VAVGLLVVLVNYGAELGLDVMPGGHQEAYFLLGLFIAGAGTWCSACSTDRRGNDDHLAPEVRGR
jgi:hypothetical protein